MTPDSDAAVQAPAATGTPPLAGQVEPAAASVEAPRGSRLAQLYDLRRRLSIEIAHEERLERGLRAARARKAVEHRQDPTPADIRAWARAQGLSVGLRGRVPSDLRHAYLKAHGAA